MFGKDAEFRDGQLDAIIAAVDGKRVLVVQQTGWGKSVVYFIASKLRREQGMGVTVLISPLLALMRNQIENAEKIGLKALTINSDNQDHWEEVVQNIIRDKCDILLLSPERLANDEFKKHILPRLNIGMFVVDEAHCISDWGHDFRPDYQRIVSIVTKLPPNIPVLATTATANNRVISDIKQQLGNNLIINRGTLIRKSLHIQIIKLYNQAERLAWLDENIDNMPGTGIIYCLTTSDCRKVSKWLKQRGHNVEPYHSKLSRDSQECSELRVSRENLLMENGVKALVSTVALGMGFDKPDIGFVIHYQRPGNLIAYYQQIGRAGRSIEDAYAVLLNGKEDDEIQEYFINSAFPTEIKMSRVLDIIEGSQNGLSINSIMNKINMKHSEVAKILKFLLLQNALIKVDSKYIRTLNEWKPDPDKSKKITELRKHELKKIKDFVDTDTCYLRYVAEDLDDPYATDCEKCANCTGVNFFPITVDKQTILEAVQFLKGDYIVIEPRKQWPSVWTGPEKGRIKKEFQVQEGRTLCLYGDAGWGAWVRDDKYINGIFRDDLVDGAVGLIKKWNLNFEWVTSIPSLRHPDLVPNFAKRVAKKLKLPYYSNIKKIKETPPQKTMENSALQATNVYDCFSFDGTCPKGSVLLIDDFVDSRWTFTVCGAMLRKIGSGEVYPFALASTAGGDINDD